VDRMTRKCAVALVVPLLLAGLLAVPAWASQPSVAAPLFSVSPTALNFGSVVVGASSHSQSITITNISGSTLTVSDAVGVADAFVGVSRCSGKVLRSGRSCHWTYKFTPKALGFVQEETDGTLNGQSYALTFTGTGLPTRRIRFTSNLITSGTDLVPFSFQIDTVSVPTAVLSVSSPLPAG